MNRLLSVTFGLLFLFTIVQVQEGHAQSIDPLIDTPGKTIGSDFNGDGVHDIIIGAPGNDDGGGANGAGAAYIFFGASNFSGTKNLGGGESADVTILGKAASDFLGGVIGGTSRSVASAGDVNGDGIHDFIVGAYQNDDGASGTDMGAAYIVFGSTSLSGTIDISGGVQSPDVTFLGKAPSDRFGRGVLGAGDVNGDGFDDVIVGAYGNDDGANGAGAAYIFFGAGNLSGTNDLGAIASADVTFIGKAGSDQFGRDGKNINNI